MKKKNGFTLVELLAVVVILAVVSIITIPIIVNLINAAQKGALKDSATGLLKSADLYYSIHKMQDKEFEDTTFSVENGAFTSEKKLDYKGQVKNAYLRVFPDGEMAICVDDGAYSIVKSTTEDMKNVNTTPTTCTGEFDDETMSFMTTGPRLTIGEVDAKGKKVLIYYNSTDDLSNNTELTCRFGTANGKYNLSAKYEMDGNGTSCYSEDYTPGVKYYYEICLTDDLGLKVCKKGEGETLAVVDAEPIYHEHTGSASGGGGCYGQANYVSEPFTDYGENCHSGPYKSEDPYAYCTQCSKLRHQHPVCKTYSFTNYRQVLTGYSINCGKTPGVTVDKYICPDGSTLSGTKCYYN